MKLEQARQDGRGRVETIPTIDVMLFLLGTSMLVLLRMQSLNSITVNCRRATRPQPGVEGTGDDDYHQEQSDLPRRRPLF